MAEASDKQPVPIVVGGSGLTGRLPVIARPPEELEEPDGFDEDGNPVWSTPRTAAKALPPNCLRNLSLPEARRSCNSSFGVCAGLQRDGSCLAELVREANARGLEWAFEVDPRDGAWVYVGETDDDGVTFP